jgi:hypothetical protein
MCLAAPCYSLLLLAAPCCARTCNLVKHKHLTYEDKVPQLSGSYSPNTAVELALAILGAVDVCMR